MVVLNCEFLSSNISSIKIKSQDSIITIIGVYCIYNNNTSDNLQIYEHQLSILTSLCEELINDNNNFILLGDFNADPFRNKYSFDRLFSEFISSNNLIKCITYRNHDFTYSNSVTTACIDHILINNNSNLKFCDSLIEHNINNTSDHNAIKIKLQCISSKGNRTDYLTSINSTNFKRSKKIINWSSCHSKELYEFFLNDKLSNIRFNSCFTHENAANFKNNINVLYENICSALIESIDDVNYVLHGNKIPGIHKQSWWTNELFHLKNKIKESRQLFVLNPSNDNRLNYKIHK